MVHFYFFSYDSYDKIVDYVEHLNLGVLDDIYMIELESGYQYMVCYQRIECPLFLKLMTDFGEKKLIYGENEHGYPLYWKIWW
jgi:hypothetical protein